MIERFNSNFHFKNLIKLAFFSSETFQRVLIQIIDQSFSNIYDEFAREMAKPLPTTTTNSVEHHL
jgi:hypothetical protein